MSDLRFKTQFRQSFVCHFHSDGQTLVLWAHTDIKHVFRFESKLDSNYRQMFRKFFEAKRDSINPMVDKHYVFCDKSRVQFYRVLLKRFDAQTKEAVVFFIDFGYEETVSLDCLFVFAPMFVDCKPLAERFLLSDIRPKDVKKGFDSQRLLSSVDRFLRSVLMIAISSDNRIKLYNNDGEDVISACLQNDDIDDIVFDTKDSNTELIAIDFDNDSESHRNSLTIASEYRTDNTNRLSDSLAEEMQKTKDKESQMSSDLIDLSSTSIIKSTDQSLETSEVDSCPLVPVFSDKTDKKSLIFHMKTLFGPKRAVYVTETFSEKSIYVQLKEQFDSVEELVHRMNVCYEDAVEEDLYPLKDMALDLTIAAQFSEDCNWYRASVLDFKRKKRLIKVLYIDFGNSETLEWKFCRFLKAEFRKMPPQAIHCRPLNQDLSVEVLELCKINTIEIECSFVALNDEIMDVMLFENGILLRSDSSVDSSPQRRKSEELKSSGDKSTEKSPQKAIESKELEKDLFESNESKKFKQKLVLNRDLLENTQDFVFSLLQSEQEVVISKTNHSQSIFCQLLNGQTQALVSDMTDYYNESKQALSESELNFFKDNRILIAVFHELEKRWLRALVVGLHDEEMVEVLHVDFGSEERVERSYCRELEDIYFAVVLQAIHCRPVNPGISYYSLKRRECESCVIRLNALNECNVCDVLFTN